MGGLNVAAAEASVLEHASNLADRATSYPLAVKIFFVATLVLALVPFLGLVRRGGPLGGVEALAFESWSAAATLPTLEVKLANTSAATVYLTSATVHVARSAPDLEPVPVVFRGTPEELRRFTIENE